MKIAARITGILLAVAVAFFGVQWYASERGEVVVLYAHDAEGKTVATRLWVVDHDGSQWLRTGGDGSGWYDRLRANETIELERGDRRADYVARPEPDRSDVVNQLMAAKYGWGDAFIGWMVGGRAGSIPIRLVPQNQTDAR